MIKPIKHIFLILAFCLCHQFASCQKNNIDSLINLIHNDKEDTLKLIHLFQVSDESETIGNYPDGLLYGERALNLANSILSENKLEKTTERVTKKIKSKTYSNIGIIYFDQGNYPEALKNHFASLKIKEEIADDRGIAASYGNIGNIYYMQRNYSSALENFLKCLKIEEKIKDKNGIARCYCGIGNVYSDQKNYREALKNYFAAFKIEKQIDDKKGIADSYNKKEAIANTEHKKELENQKSLSEERSRKQKAIIIFVIVGLLLVLIFSAFVFRSLQTTRKQKNIIEEQKIIVEEKQHEIIASIFYARRIQQSLLPPDSYIHKTLERLRKK